MKKILNINNFWYCIDTEATFGTWYYDKESINFPILENRIWTENNWKHYAEHIQWIIATNNPNLPLPQLSQNSLQLIVDMNSELCEFDVIFSYSGNEGNIAKIHFPAKETTSKIYTEEEVEVLLHKITKLAITEPETFCEGICYDSYKVMNWFSNNKKK